MEPFSPDSPPFAEANTHTMQENGHKSSEGADDGSISNLDKIRDILFGAELRDHEIRFTRLEQTLLREAHVLRDELQQRFEALDTFVKREVEVLTNRLAQEHAAGSGAFSTLMSELATLSAAVERSAAAFDGRLAQLRDELMRNLAERAAELLNETGARHAKAQALLEHAVVELRREKLDRTALAAVFMEASLKIAPEDSSRVTE